MYEQVVARRVACLDFAVCTESGIHVSLKSGAAGSGCACVIETCPLASRVVMLHFAAGIIVACDAVT